VAIYIVVPLTAGVLLRRWLIGQHGKAWFEEQLLPASRPSP